MPLRTQPLCLNQLPSSVVSTLVRESVSLNQLPSSVISTLVRESVSLNQLPSSVVSTLVRESVSLSQLPSSVVSTLVRESVRVRVHYLNYLIRKNNQIKRTQNKRFLFVLGLYLVFTDL